MSKIIHLLLRQQGKGAKCVYRHLESVSFRFLWCTLQRDNAGC